MPNLPAPGCTWIVALEFSSTLTFDLCPRHSLVLIALVLLPWFILLSSKSSLKSIVFPPMVLAGNCAQKMTLLFLESNLQCIELMSAFSF